MIHLASQTARRVGIVIASCVMMMSAHAATKDLMEIKVGIQTTPPDEVYRVKDWGAKYNLKVSEGSYSSGAEILKAFIAGQIDIGNGGSGRLVTMAAMQPDLFYIVATNEYGGDRYGVVVASNSSIKSVAELKGKKIGVVAGSGCYSTFRVYLDKNGMKESDFQIVNMKVEDLRAAVQQGIIDAAVLWEPHGAIGETMGAVKRIQSMGGVSVSPNLVLVSRKFADEHPEAVARYIATLIDVGQFIKSQPEKAASEAAANISKRGVTIDPKALELSLTRTTVDPKLSDIMTDELVPVAASMKAAGKISVMPDFKKLVRNDFYEQAVKLSSQTN
jgi:ABC-type nitrate/sulfonate/bicarbonate transport system substrate-binding protein